MFFPEFEPDPPLKQLILGGARSGKSALAERLADESGLSVLYLATATATRTGTGTGATGDAEMAERIRRHRERRPPHWGLIEEPQRLAAALQREAGDGRCLLVDCLTLWLGNLMAMDDAILQAEQQALLDGLERLPGHIILVSNEVGLGIVPMNATARRFRDLAGRLHQQLAARCDRVVFTVAGLPQILKGPPL